LHTGWTRHNIEPCQVTHAWPASIKHSARTGEEHEGPKTRPDFLAESTPEMDDTPPDLAACLGYISESQEADEAKIMEPDLEPEAHTSSDDGQQCGEVGARVLCRGEEHQADLPARCRKA
jgi:hypothetical protein